MANKVKLEKERQITHHVLFWLIVIHMFFIVHPLLRTVPTTRRFFPTVLLLPTDAWEFSNISVEEGMDNACVNV